MTLLQNMLSGQNGAMLNQIAGQFGLDGQQAQAAMQQLVPALAGGVKKNAANPEGAQSLMNALQKGNHQAYADRPETLAQPETINEGNAILGHLLGSKDNSRQIAAQAAQQTGIDPSTLKQMLPVLATAVMGNLSKQTQGAGNPLQGLMNQALGGNNAQSGGLMDMLGGFLDTDNDGSFIDDVVGMIGKR